MLLGTTYSHRFAKFLQLDPIKSFHGIMALNFDIIRLCCYWDEIQNGKNSFDYTAIKQLLDICEKHHQQVVMTIGMKAPRYPEFYIPKIADPDVLTFVERTVQALKHYSCIKYWQVENEPLDPSGPDGKTIPIDTLTQEISLVKNLDSRPIVLTLWGNELTKRGYLPSVTGLADIVGIDLYYKQYVASVFGKNMYKGPSDSDSKLRKIIASSSKPIWITELQAEPWEKNMEAYKSDVTTSMSAEILINNFKKTKELNLDAILFWGSEYWIWKKKIGDDSYWEVIKGISKR